MLPSAAPAQINVWVVEGEGSLRVILSHKEMLPIDEGLDFNRFHTLTIAVDSE